jgi:hypothetical protein
MPARMQGRERLAPWPTADEQGRAHSQGQRVAQNLEAAPTARAGAEFSGGGPCSVMEAE